jgi:hypothetical protein
MSTDKSAGDTSDIISDSSGVGTSNSDTTTCSLQPSTTVVCLQPYEPAHHGHLRLNKGDIVDGKFEEATLCSQEPNIRLSFKRYTKRTDREH